LLPPFAHQALLRADAVDPERVNGFLKAARAWAEPVADGVELLGPAPAPMERRAGRYRAHLLTQATQRQDLHRFLHRWTALLWAERQDRQVRWSLDVDPLELY
jgi:primosomal protein N' (replication factor Y)